MLPYNSTLSLSDNSSQATNEISYTYYYGLNLVIGLLAMLANGFLLVILIYFLENRRQTTNVLIINQTSMDLITSIGIIISYVTNDFTATYFPDSLGYAKCLLFHESIFQYTGLLSSVIGLSVIAGERYVKIVHSILHRKHYRPWMIYYMVTLSLCRLCRATADKNIILFSLRPMALMCSRLGRGSKVELRPVLLFAAVNNSTGPKRLESRLKRLF